MEQFTELVNFVGSLGTVLTQVAIVFIVALLLSRKFLRSSVLREGVDKQLGFISEHSILIAFTTALVSTIFSLVYSDVIGYEPCKLCWIQRIFLYPQVIIFGLALWKKTRDSEVYCLFLSVIGAVIAGYHYYGQSFNPNALPACDVVGGASCAVRFFVEFGYVTLPLMAFTSFVFITVVVLASRNK